MAGTAGNSVGRMRGDESVMQRRARRSPAGQPHSAAARPSIRAIPSAGARLAAAARTATLALTLAAASGAIAGALAQGAREDRVFTIGNYPIEARAADAVEAKNRAVAEGQQAAFRSLLKRIVPVTFYNRLPKLKAVKAAEYVDGVAVRSERNSQTEYIATYDIAFQGEAVRRLLDKEGIPFLDRQAAPITLVPVYVPPKEAGTPEPFEDARGSDAWLYAWKGLDLANTLTPVALKTVKREVHAEAIRALAGGDAKAIRALAGELRTETVIVAILEPDLASRKVSVVLAGRDAVAPFVLKRIYRLDGADLAYTAELAAVISLGILEGRWKAINVRTRGAGGAYTPVSGGPRESPLPIPRPEPADLAGDGPIRIAVEFRDMSEWQRISRQLSATPEVSDLDVEGLSGRGARITLRYPRGARELAVALAQGGLILRQAGSGWVLTQR